MYICFKNIYLKNIFNKNRSNEDMLVIYWMSRVFLHKEVDFTISSDYIHCHAERHVKGRTGCSLSKAEDLSNPILFWS